MMTLRKEFPTWRRLTLAGLTTLLLAGCSGPQLADYAAERPVLNFREYFSGDVVAHGVVTDRWGKVVRRFIVAMRCTWEGNQGTLDEHFTYSDGARQRRVWRLTQHPDGRLTGTADDVRGVAEGATAGNAFNWRYTLQLPIGGRVWDVQFDDWMYLVDPRTMINKAVMSKFGIRLGEVTLSFSKP